MDALHALLNRTSFPQLAEPGPSKEQLASMIRAGLRAPDHAGLQPWRFIVVAGAAREKLGNIMAQISLEDNPDLPAVAVQKIHQQPLRAPLLLLPVLRHKEHHKVPKIEQILSLGASVEAVLLAAYAQGVGAFWRTGEMAYHPTIARSLGLTADEHLFGFIYMGTPVNPEEKVVQPARVEDFLTVWDGVNSS